MTHEIETHDGLVLHKTKAWHGLGTVVADAPTPTKALRIAGMDWEVEQWPMSATNGEGEKIALPEQVLNVRSDTRTPLGIVTTNYKPIQNSTLAEFCELLAEQSDTVKVESAGSIRNGGKVWFLLKGDSFSVRGKDEVKPYILVSNGHDGGTALRGTCTTVRVVCSNTLHMVIPKTVNDKVRLDESSYVANHMGDILQKVEDAKAVLELYGRSLTSTRELIDQVAAKEMTREDVQSYFLQCYTRDFGAIASNPTTAREETARTKSQRAFQAYDARFNDEIAIAGTTAWNAMNAYTGWSQNDRTFWKNESKESDRKIGSKLFGQDAERAARCLLLALSM